jgi:hypothetical protein
LARRVDFYRFIGGRPCHCALRFALIRTTSQCDEPQSRSLSFTTALCRIRKLREHF